MNFYHFIPFFDKFFRPEVYAMYLTLLKNIQTFGSTWPGTIVGVLRRSIRLLGIIGFNWFALLWIYSLQFSYLVVALCLLDCLLVFQIKLIYFYELLACSNTAFQPLTLSANFVHDSHTRTQRCFNVISRCFVHICVCAPSNSSSAWLYIIYIFCICLSWKSLRIVRNITSQIRLPSLISLLPIFDVRSTLLHGCHTHTYKRAYNINVRFQQILTAHLLA